LSLRARRRRVTAAGSALAAGGLALFVGGPWSARFIAPGPLSRTHASAALVAAPDGPAWSAAGCDQCHRPAAAGVARRPVTDGACLNCHAGEAHHAARSSAAATTAEGGHPMAAGCASCHVEHRGTDHDLRRVADRTCVACHAGVHAWRRRPAEPATARARYPALPALEPPLDPLAPVADSIRSFALDHPEFAVVADPKRTDETWLRFEHHTHMLKSSRNMTRDLEALQRALGAAAPASVARASDGSLSLRCTACHQLEPAGRSMLPISFAAHCQTCHGGANLEFDEAKIPHGSAARPALDLLLERTLAEGGDAGDEEARDELRQEIEREAAAQCGKCHSDAAGERLGAIDRIKPPAVPRRWMTRAIFDHKAHLFMDCLDCHARAMADPEAEPLQLPDGASRWSGRTREIMLPGIESCRACHAPRPGRGTAAAHECVACHRYHEPALPPEVRTSLTRGRTAGPAGAAP
jgi:hypothetical protein